MEHVIAPPQAYSPLPQILMDYLIKADLVTAKDSQAKRIIRYSWCVEHMNKILLIAIPMKYLEILKLWNLIKDGLLLEESADIYHLLNIIQCHLSLSQSVIKIYSFKGHWPGRMRVLCITYGEG